ncbi:MAG: DUF433 domain-containing protein [Balneolaceae bacterium]|nr:DUF433 domain-containing protein [Balneolaceae bacterium]
MTTKMVHPYITKDKDIGGGKPIIRGTRTRVSNLIAYYKLGYTPEELEQSFPHLSLAKIYDALSFYHDNREQIDYEIEADKEANFIDNDE